MHIRIVILGACLSAAVASADELNWNELTRRPELWPAQCALKSAMQFDSGAVIRAGQKVNVLGFKGNEVVLRSTDGRIDFAAAPNETDVLEVARANYEKLTPNQQALTYPLLAQKRELWPATVTVTSAFHLGSGITVQRGEQLLLDEVRPDLIAVRLERLRTKFTVPAQLTDLMAQARVTVESKTGVSDRFVADERRAAEAKRLEEKRRIQGPVVAELEGRLINSVSGKPEPLDSNALPRYIVFLRGSTTCSITRGFTPKLVEFYQQMKPKHPEFEVVYLTVDDLNDTEKFANEFGFNWRAVTYENATMPSVNPHIDGRLPQLIVMDRNGRVLANGIQATAPAALQQLGALLNQSTAQN